MSLLAVGSIIEAVGKVAGDLITTDKERMEMEVEQRKLCLLYTSPSPRDS